MQLPRGTRTRQLLPISCALLLLRSISTAMAQSSSPDAKCDFPHTANRCVSGHGEQPKISASVANDGKALCRAQAWRTSFGYHKGSRKCVLSEAQPSLSTCRSYDHYSVDRGQSEWSECNSPGWKTLFRHPLPFMPTSQFSGGLFSSSCCTLAPRDPLHACSLGLDHPLGQVRSREVEYKPSELTGRTFSGNNFNEWTQNNSPMKEAASAYMYCSWPFAMVSHTGCTCSDARTDAPVFPGIVCSI